MRVDIQGQEIKKALFVLLAIFLWCTLIFQSKLLGKVALVIKAAGKTDVGNGE